MLETKEQKQYLVTVLVLVLILGLISFWRNPGFRFRDTTDYSKPSQAIIDANAYLKYLGSLEIDPKASQELFEKILTKEDVQREVEAELKINQPIVPPFIDQEKIKIAGGSGQQAVVDYLTSTLGPIESFNNRTGDLNKTVFGQDADAVDRIKGEFGQVYGKILGAETPKETLDMHKALLTAYAAYDRLLDSSKSYATGENSEPWPDVYRDYVVINDNLKKYNAEFKELSDKYQLASLPPLHYVEKTEIPEDAGDKGFALVPTVHAFLGLGDITIVVGDIPSLIKDGIEQGLAASFSQFMGAFIQKLVEKIESNYLIANFLYYSDALVSGQYTDDYLNKYVTDTLDRQIVKKFIPQFNCGQNQDLRPLFKAKANQYLGFDPETVDPRDPDYYQKMSQVGSFLASPNGWDIYYQDLAAQAKSEAEKAAEKELSSSGLKTPRDTVNSTIAKSINSIVSSQQAGLTAMMQLGGQVARSFISSFVAQLTQSLMSNFVFRGVTGSGQAGVLKEQSTCLAAAQIQLVVPVTGTRYQPPAPQPSEQDLLCTKYPEQCPPPTNNVSPRGE